MRINSSRIVHRLFVFPILRFPANKCFGYVRDVEVQREIQKRDRVSQKTVPMDEDAKAQTDHFGFDGTVALACFRKHVPFALAKVPKLDGFGHLL